MRSRISSPNEFWAGLLYIVFGIAALWLGVDYKMSTAGHVGPGYFPKVLAGILILIGVAALGRAFLLEGQATAAIHWKPLFLILLGNVLFAFLINRLGLVVALPLLVLTSAAASAKFSFDWRAAAGLVALTALCSLVFVIGLGVPMPIVGAWLEPLLGTVAWP